MKQADGYISEEFKSNHSEQHATDLAQYIHYSEQHATSNYSEQQAEYSEQYVNLSEQHALWLIHVYKISSSAACSYGVWTLEIAHQPHHGLIYSLPSGDLP